MSRSGGIADVNLEGIDRVNHDLLTQTPDLRFIVKFFVKLDTVFSDEFPRLSFVGCSHLHRDWTGRTRDVTLAEPGKRSKVEDVRAVVGDIVALEHWHVVYRADETGATFVILQPRWCRRVPATVTRWTQVERLGQTPVHRHDYERWNEPSIS